LNGEGFAVRVVPCTLLLCCCLTLAGCKAFGKKDAGSSSSGGGGTANTGTLARGQATPPPPAAPPDPAMTVSGSGVLAGQVIDNSNRRMGGAFIQVAEAGDRGVKGAPIEIAADQQGYFIIPGVQSGKRYLLTARVRDGGHMLIGAIWATPPDPKLVIRLDDRGGAPAAAGLPSRPDRPAAAADPGWGAGSRRAAELGAPIGATNGMPPPDPPPAAAPMDPRADPENPLDPRTRIRPENTVQRDPDATAHNDSPPVDMPSRVHNQYSQNPAPPPPGYPGAWAPPPSSQPTQQYPAAAGYAVPGAPGDRQQPFGPPRVPSCVLTGQTLYNFALNDLSGQPWEYRQHRGRLVLIDFWGTWCLPCLHAIPHLNILQQQYGPRGLEVIGVAYESGTPAEQTRKVNDVRNRLHMNYRVLLGGEKERCPVRTQFAVRAFPTMVLVDETGRIIWRGEGADQQHLRDLEIVIQQRLMVR
jgi:thiol-disulfide isomerase/thioredoxin